MIAQPSPVETQIYLNRFKPRGYQIPICDAVENKGYRKVMCILPRRAGKDLVAWNLLIRGALRHVGVYIHCLPTYKQAKEVIWDSVTNSGDQFLSYIPKELVSRVNRSEMKIFLINGSIIKLSGSNKYDQSIVGSNPRMVVFSEYAMADRRAYTLGASPILKANGGKVIFLSTPRGRNHLYDLYEIAKVSPDWFCYKLTIDDTLHVDWNEIKLEIARGEISEDEAYQEYYTSFDIGVEGSYYAKYINNLRLKEQIGDVEWEPSHKVHTAWDIGLSDKTCIVWFQCIGRSIHIIDYYENKDHGLEHYVRIINEKPYVYGTHIAPHDITVREWAAGAVTRIDKARELGIHFDIAPKLSVHDGIEAVRTMLPRCWIDETKCARLIKALESYRREFNSKKQSYHEWPLHDWASDPADAVRMMAVGLPKTHDGMTAADAERLYRQARYGSDESNLPRFFRDY